MGDGDEYREMTLTLVNWLQEHYWRPLYGALKADRRLLKTFPGFLVKPENVIFHLGRHHLGIEYMGPERITELPENGHLISARIQDNSLKECNLLQEIVGFDYGTDAFAIPLQPVTEDLVLPTNAAVDELIKLGWNWDAQSMIVGIGSGCAEVPMNQFARLINARFYDANAQGGLKTRHIKWLDFVPWVYDDSGIENDVFGMPLELLDKLAVRDIGATYPIPSDFRLGRLQQMNRFVEFIGDRTNTEPDITKLLASDELRFALQMRFSAREVHAERICEWQTGDRKPIKPDFFVVGTDGFAEIVEFKLPYIHGATVVGTDNRETFSAAINSYISQTRVYREYFDDPRNRAYVKSTYGFDCYKPRRHLVIGRRWDFDSQTWKEIASDHADLTIHTYDDLIDGIVMQFYG